MGVALDNGPGERVLLYGADGSTLRQVVVDSSGRLVVVGVAGGTAVIVSATDLDIRNLAKTQDELYAVLRDDSSNAYDARRVQGIDGSTQRQVAVDGSGRLRISAPQERTTALVGAQYVASVAPHGNTSRLSYTVPTGRIAVLSLVQMRLTRDGAAAPVGIALARLVVTPTGASAFQALRVLHITNTVGDAQGIEVAPNLWLEAACVLEMFTQDGSTGGTIDYELSITLTEFDA